MKKKIKNKKTIKKTKTPISKDTKQLIWIIAVIAIVFLAFLVPYFYVQSLKKFTFAGTDWRVEKDGEITFYHTQFAKIYRGVNYGTHNTYLRNDPRENNVEINIGSIEFYRKMIITQSAEVLECPNAVLASTTIGYAPLALPFINPKAIISATSNQTTAKNFNIPFADCKNATNETTVISIVKSDKTEIRKDQNNRNCYLIKIADCKDNLKATERFVIELNKQLNEESEV